jgi:hypothetical protein
MAKIIYLAIGLSHSNVVEPRSDRSLHSGHMTLAESGMRGPSGLAGEAERRRIPDLKFADPTTKGQDRTLHS